ncbi:MAG: AarF/ABC1/UbiB kinase family protein [Acidobacteria bacterium]|nr:AarF/ABC1/UbiB kinase family protein [Acidobacteriota bacterium]
MFPRRSSALGRTYRHAQRYRQILGVLLKHGYYDLLKNLKIDQYLEGGLKRFRGPAEQQDLSRAERFRRALEELGPTFVKAGQLLSTRPDLLPVDFLEQLSRLQDSVAPFPFAEVREIVEEELGAPLDELFDHFDEEPLAAASIGQVHGARTAAGEEVVVKVRRPGVRAMLEVDLEILMNLATLMERRLEGWDVHRPTRVVEELGVSLDRELDYRMEAANQEHFAWQFRGDGRVRVPKVLRRVTTEKVLTMERIDGVRSSDVEELRRRGDDPVSLATLVAELSMRQIFDFGFFHGDPHPGNVFVLDGGVICYLDFGMMGRIDRSTREDFAGLVLGIVRRDSQGMKESLLALCHHGGEADPPGLERDLAEFADRHFFRPLREIRLGDVLQQLLELAARHQLGIPPDLFLMIKALANVEGLCRGLDPDFEISSHAAPFLRRIQLERYYPQRLARDLAESGGEVLALMRDVPGELRATLAQLRRGRSRLGFELRGLDPLNATLDRVSNVLAFAIVLAALIIGSSLIVLAGVPPLWHGIPLIGLAGFVVAAVMGFWLLASILRHGRM